MRRNTLRYCALRGLLGHKASKTNGALSLKLVRRLKAIEALPPKRQKFVLQTLDALLRDSTRE